MSIGSPGLEARPLVDAADPTLVPLERRPVFSAKERRTLFVGLDAIALFATSWLLLGLEAAEFALCLTACLVAGLVLVRFYRRARGWSPWQVAFSAFKGITVGGAAASAGVWLVAPASLGTLATAAFAGCGAVVGWRLVFFRAFAATPMRRVVIVGADDLGTRLADEIRRQALSGYRAIGFVDDRATARDGALAGLPVLGSAGDLAAICDRYGVGAVVVKSVQVPYQAALVECLERGTEVLTFATVFEELIAKVPLPSLDLSWFLYELRGREGRFYAVSKRALDLVLASVGLAVTAGLFPAIALAIKLGGGKGPIFYSQVRVGLRGQEFKIHKFRTMRQDAEKDGAVWAAVHDDRVTRVGSFLRQTRLDELPQFWNVLKGEMSLVGPRPERPEFVRQLEQAIPFYQRRHMVAPGVTGWAQVKFPYGASVEDALEKLQYDLYYLKNRSLYLDLKVMVKTVGVMVKKVGGR